MFKILTSFARSVSTWLWSFDKNSVLADIATGNVDVRDLARWSDDQEVMEAAIARNSEYFPKASPRLRDQEDFVLREVNQPHGTSYGGHISTRLRNDRGFALQLVTQNNFSACLLKDLSQHMQNDPTVVMAAVKTNSLAFQYASNELRQNHAVALEAIKSAGTLIRDYIPRELIEDPRFMLQAIAINSNFFRYIPKVWRHHTPYVLAAIRQHEGVADIVIEQIQNEQPHHYTDDLVREMTLYQTKYNLTAKQALLRLACGACAYSAGATHGIFNPSTKINTTQSYQERTRVPELPPELSHHISSFYRQGAHLASVCKTARAAATQEAERVNYDLFP